MSMSLVSLSGQFMVIRNSALRSTAPLLAVGRMSANAMNTMNVRPSTTLNSISVKGTKVPSSLLFRGSSWSIRVALQDGDDVNLRHLGDGVDEIHHAHTEKVVLQFENQRRAYSRHRDVKRN